MHSELAWKIVSAWILVLQFDGSFRPPKDPGYPTVAAKMATCAACFFFVSDLHDACDPVTIVLGSRFLPITMDMTSAHAEYEGLLLGLEWLSKHSQSVLSSDYVLSTTTITTPDQTQKLIIQGDCKAVIDQLSGKSISWKLQKEHDQAMKFLNDFSHYFDSIDFDHIPRKENVLSDSLCSNTMLAVESFHYQRCCMVLDGALLLGNEKHQSHHVSSFQRYINSDTSLIRNSLRPFLLSRMLKLAEEHNDYQSMLQIGEYVFTEAKQFTIEKDKAAVWKSTGVANQVNGLRGMGRKKKAAALERKHRILLKSHNAIPLESQNEPVENSVMPWDSTINEAWLPLLNNWSQHATQQQSWIETNGSTIWSQLHAPISPEED